MNTIQCPSCKQILEGEFEMTDELKCPACRTTFVPANLFNATLSATQRPKEVLWAVAILMGGFAVALGLAFLLFAIGAISVRWDSADNEFRFIVFWLPTHLLHIFVTWKLYRGKTWARHLFNWWLAIGLLFGGLLLGGKVYDSLIQSSLHGASISAFSLRVWPAMTFLVSTAYHGILLYLINRKAVRTWFSRPTEQSAPPRPRWWIWAIVYYAVVVTLTILFGILAPKNDNHARNLRNEVSPHTTNSSSARELVLSLASDASQKTVLQTSSPSFNPKNPSGTKQLGIVVRAKELRTVSLPSGLTMRLRGCPAGSFIMGSPDWEDGHLNEEIQHRVTLTKGFWMGETEVTQGQWKSLMDDETVYDLTRKMLRDDNEYLFAGERETIRDFWGYSRNSDPSTICFSPDDAAPVFFVNWFEAARFCARLTAQERKKGRLPNGYVYRLPTEAEWEYACRAGTTTSLPNGTEINILGVNNAPALDDIAWYGGNSSVGFIGHGYETEGWPEKQYPGGTAGPHKVGIKKPNDWGIFDTIGNVSEWCLDWKANYSQESVVDPVGPSTGLGHVIRGGSWSLEAALSRAATRSGVEPGVRLDGVGFRVVLAPEIER